MNLIAYKARGEARPAYRRAYAAHEAVFTARLSVDAAAPPPR